MCRLFVDACAPSSWLWVMGGYSWVWPHRRVRRQSDVNAGHACVPNQKRMEGTRGRRSSSFGLPENPTTGDWAENKEAAHDFTVTLTLRSGGVSLMSWWKQILGEPRLSSWTNHHHKEKCFASLQYGNWTPLLSIIPSEVPSSQVLRLIICLVQYQSPLWCLLL